MKKPAWIVNDLGELGVKIKGRCFFLYKGRSIEYKEKQLDDDERPMQYRPVGKREFGEVCHPLDWSRNVDAQGLYTVTLTFTPGMSDGRPEDCDWRPLPKRKEGSK